MSTAKHTAGRRSSDASFTALGCALCLLCTSGCGSMLPRSDIETQSNWSSFEAARAAFDGIVPYRSTVADLAAIGIDPFAHPNITILSYSDVIRRFIPGPQLPAGSIALGVQDCIAANEECRAYEIEIQSTKRKRVGNFFLDFLSFVRKTEVTGWKFDGLVLIRGNLVVYKLWSGQPRVVSNERTRNPLGPLQGAISSGSTGAP